jgi:hypothetical protein
VGLTVNMLVSFCLGLMAASCQWAHNVCMASSWTSLAFCKACHPSGGHSPYIGLMLATHPVALFHFLSEVT